jgi:hypothetical protein
LIPHEPFVIYPQSNKEGGNRKMERQLRVLIVAVLVIGLTVGITYAADVSSDILVYWPLDDDVKDSIGSHDGKLVGGAKFADDPDRDKVLSLDGIDDHVEIPHSADLVFQPTDSFSISVWLNIQALPGHWAGVVTKSRDQSPWYGLWVNPSNSWHFDGGDGGTNVRLDASRAETGWLHLAGVYDADAHIQTVYVNGEILGEGVGATIAATGGGDIWFGGAKGVNEFLHALIDDVAIYKRALAPEDIKALANGASIGGAAVEPHAKLTTTWGTIRQ